MAVFSYAVLRFALEYLRADGTLVIGNLTLAQLQCIALALSIVLLPRFRRSVVS
jgi:prolipoprotein diacylglyceryltransferase